MNDLEFKILERIDQTIRRESEHTEIYKLNLAPAIDVKKAIGDLINDGLIKYISGSTILRLTKAGILQSMNHIHILTRKNPFVNSFYEFYSHFFLQTVFTK